MSEKQEHMIQAALAALTDVFERFGRDEVIDAIHAYYHNKGK